MALYELWFDGAATKERNRVSSFGFVLKLDGKEITHGYGLIGRGENMNELTGEMLGLSYGLSAFVQHLDKANAELKIYGDSAIVIRRITNPRPARDRDVQIIKSKLQDIARLKVTVTISWTSRENNKIANDLAKKLRAFQC